MMHIIVCDVACLAIAAMYYSWRDLYVPHLHRESKQLESETMTSLGRFAEAVR